MRVRFVDSDGRSFFAEVDTLLPVWRLFRRVPAPVDWFGDEPTVQTRTIDNYRLEEWFIPYGPPASPLLVPLVVKDPQGYTHEFPNMRFLRDAGSDNIVDLVYRFMSEDRR